MNSLSAGVRNETQKIFLRRKTFIFLFLTAAFPVASAVLFSFVQRKSGFTITDSVNFPLLVLGLVVNFLLPLFIFMTASDVFAGEEGDKTLKIVLTRPITRLNVFVSKNAAVGIFIIIHLAVIFVASFLSGLVLEGTGAMQGLGEGLKAYIVSCIPMISLSFACIFFAQFFKSASGALTTSIFIYLCIKGLPFILPKLAKFLPFSYTDWYTLWLGHTAGIGNIFPAFMYLLSYSILFFVAGFYLFDRKEL
ncbi:ABC transporter permease [Aneurinibacillus terranovensis]|uniref:ABC transporter permease n=1 Tax=Aneurinibacillus terranovensis TaxID=278991 RepID=UPI0004141DD7|nr:ABC transporter permease [Aneurinibacillus terranovensis]